MLKTSRLFKLFLVSVSVLCSCKKMEDKSTVQVFADENTSWITDNRSLPAEDSLFYLDYPAAQFRKEFLVSKTVKNAQLFITAAGYYKAYLNGEDIGDRILDPAWTDFSKRIFYSEYDVTQQVLENGNCLGVTLGNGFYNPLPLRKWGRRNLRNDLSVGKPSFIAKLVINYEDGSSHKISTDNTWTYQYGPIRHNSVYLGVRYDARQELAGWNHMGYDDNDWSSAVETEGPGGVLQSTFFPPVRVTKELVPVDIYSVAEDSWIFDIGVNFTGTYRMKLSGEEGDTVSLRFGERVYDDGTLNPMTTVIGQIKRPGVGGPGAPDIAWQTDQYIIGAETGWFQPDFTYHVFRYIEVKGLRYKPSKEDVVGLFLHSDVQSGNQFSSSSALLDEIQEVTRRTFLANMISVQSDCPAREKFGYGGDINATSESFIYNFDMRDFYRKTVYDWLDGMNDSTFIDTAPYVGIKYCGISWESAFLLTQYYLYLYYNDVNIIEELYEKDLQWMDKVARLHPGGIVESGLSDHESLEPVPVALTGTCHYIQCARIMSEFADAMNDEVNSTKYKQLAEDLTSKVKVRFWDQPVNKMINRQTLFSTLLFHKVVPEDEIEAAVDSLLKAVKSGPSGHFNTGIFGTKYVLETLSRYESPQTVFNIVNSREFPGWGFMIENGATTLWETWKESDNTYSNCHPMFGSVTEWYYRWLGGIRPLAEHPGFSRFTLAPSTPSGLDAANCTYQSPHGPIISNWKRTNTGGYQYELSIPEGTTADVELRIDDNQQLTINQPVSDPEDLNDGIFSLSGGSYVLTVSDN